MTLLKRKSALWHGWAILLLDWVSGPLKTGAAQFPRKEHTSHQALTLFTSGRGGRLREGGWVFSGVGGIQSVPIVATVQLHLSQQRWDYFYKASDSVPRQQSRLKTSAESTLKAERKDWMANGFSICDTTTALTLLFLSWSPTLWPDICQVCVKKERRPISPPPLLFFSSSLPPAPPPLLPPPLPSFSLLLHSLFHSLAGRVALLSLHRQDLWSQGLWQKQKGICQYLWETLCQPSSSSIHWCSQPH